MYTIFLRNTYRIYKEYTDCTLYSAGLPALSQLQDYVKRQKPSYKAKKSGLLLTGMTDLIAFSQSYSIPSTLALLNDAPSSSLVRSTVGDDSLFIPMQAAAYGIHGACYTGKTQIGWMGQLSKMPQEWQVHIDGKYKLHHAKFLLLSIGTHYLRYDHHNSTLSNSFAPLVYLFCKEGESDGAVQILIDALLGCARKYYSVKLTPGAGTSDHAAALRKAMETTWPDIEYGQCYPHLIRKFGEGEFFKGTGTTKSWEHFDDAKNMIRDIHLAESTGMKYLIIKEVGKIWDKWGHQMDTFWDSNLTNPWDCWSICDLDTMLSTPSNQVQESWHKQILQSRIPGMFKGSTESVITTALPRLIRLDGALLPYVLCFNVGLSSPSTALHTRLTHSPRLQVPAVPRGILEKAKWYVDHRLTHLHVEKDRGSFFYYFLRQSNEAGLKKVTNKSLQAYLDALNQKRAPWIKSYKELRQVCQSYHYATAATRRVAGSEFNSACLCCTCKGFHMYGICSHVVAVNDILGKVDLSDSLKELCAPRKKGGFRQGVRPALIREKEAEAAASDSSEDEPLSNRVKNLKHKKEGLQLP